MTYLIEQMQVLRVSRYDPAEEHRSVLHLRTNPPDLFDHPPVVHPHLESTEELLAVVGKKRMGAVLSLPATQWRNAAGSQGDEPFLLVPLYSFHETHSDDFRLRVRAFEFPSLVFSPGEAENGSRLDGFFLLERAQWVARSLMTPANFTLTDGALEVVENWFQYLTSGTMQKPEYVEFREILMSELLGR